MEGKGACDIPSQVRCSELRLLAWIERARVHQIVRVKRSLDCLLYLDVVLAVLLCHELHLPNPYAMLTRDCPSCKESALHHSPLEQMRSLILFFRRERNHAVEVAICNVCANNAWNATF